MAYNTQPISLEQTIAALRGGGNNAANAISAATKGYDQAQEQGLAARKAALAKRMAEAGLVKGSELGGLASDAGMSIAPDRELSEPLVNSLLDLKGKTAKGSVTPVSKDYLYGISATLPTDVQAQFLASTADQPLMADKIANLAARLGTGQRALDVQKQQVNYKQETDPARLKTNMFARQASTGAADLDKIQETYGTGLLDQIPMFEQFKSEDRKLFDNARKTFANAILRPETGAVINKAEYADLDQRYIPLPGDGKDVLAHKQAARNDMVRLLNAVRGGDPDAIARLNSEFPEAADNARIRANSKPGVKKTPPPKEDTVTKPQPAQPDEEDLYEDAQ